MASKKNSKTGEFTVIRHIATGDCKVVSKDELISFREFSPESGNYEEVSTHDTKEDAESSVVSE